MEQSENYITEEKFKALKLELIDLKGPKRKEILDTLAYAKSLGDLSENAEYHQAREDQGKLEERIQKVEEILRSSKVVSASGGDIIEIGSKVLVLKEGESKEITFQIVGSEEADMAQGKISNKSPFGKALFGKKKGDNVSFKTPNGQVDYRIINVS
ncbi:MAG: Transcription elongation factor GreA [Candidatus Nomurabacteria bacterium GW2011_GWE1_32_28]|uniref:Transcription elongation factor GreA n=1 Tax=Candidatus Nomurabacteria bacterium GW2011_GWF1_31_48 TaxID=1618767 RepID=A0A0G0AV19_9BACT|nr:MAG: Transcription elongation factor GreA [Candidatus Nomurabacteria bacterium GW2011_GWF2_30_133]KKP29065.1 MAG: Transcription elongation factor GreA [Candidatus Nomurabacteria bacterium GW2011_GWE2_31_40]KKP30525.1 MAG: Transcription elongation factor GreA [Candidatus Nomurabacteria bacterium GW2011_GWF1_31_48]KKP35010.1 MAG: Transcription elongation factor GreA [Candidatus Nomurabacteria bacterium GW2011_GWE1_32_28]HAS80622.1 transcription elongation factor GreA [Candidatus Nomurabacteria